MQPTSMGLVYSGMTPVEIGLYHTRTRMNATDKLNARVGKSVMHVKTMT